MDYPMNALQSTPVQLLSPRIPRYLASSASSADEPGNPVAFRAESPDQGGSNESARPAHEDVVRAGLLGVDGRCH